MSDKSPRFLFFSSYPCLCMCAVENALALVTSASRPRHFIFSVQFVRRRETPAKQACRGCRALS